MPSRVTPRRAASYAGVTAYWPAPVRVATTAMSLGPVHTGSVGPETTSTVTGLEGPSRARSTDAATAPSRRATMTRPRGRPPSVTRPSPASAVSRAVSRTCAPAPATAGSRPRGSRARSSSGSSKTSSANSDELIEASRVPVPGLVQEQDGDAVAHREGPVAGGAEQLARLLVDRERAVMGVRAGQDRQQIR